MRKSIRKHYSQLNRYVRAANLGWDELDRYNEFPTLYQLDPYGKHRKLLDRIERAFRSKLRNIRPAAVVPLLNFPNWQLVVRSDWQRLHCYALVRRLFDTLPFLTRTSVYPTAGALQIQITLQVSVDKEGATSRVSDPFEVFLAELTNAGDLRRLGSCPACRRFFVAWRLDQKACSRPCANLMRVHKFRKKKEEYVANRKFRKRTGLQAPRQGRQRIVRLAEALRLQEPRTAPSTNPQLTTDDGLKPSSKFK
jgi:hypothetical protein